MLQKVFLSLLPLIIASGAAHAQPERAGPSASQASSSDLPDGQDGLGVEDVGGEYDGAGEEDGLAGEYDGEGEELSVESAVNAMPDRFAEQPLESADGRTIGTVQQVLRRRSDEKVFFLVSPAADDAAIDFVVSVDDLAIRGDRLSVLGTEQAELIRNPYVPADYVNLEEHVPCGALC